MNDLHVDSQLASAIINNHDPNRASSISKRVIEVTPESALIDNRQALLHVSSLGHSNDVPVLADIQDAVLLEHRPEHILDDDAGAGVRDEAALLVELLGEQIDAEVSVLAGLRAGGDADDLARAALEHEQVADADVVAGDSDSVRSSSALDIPHRLAAAGGRSRAHEIALVALDDDLVAVMVVAAAVDGVQDAVGGALEAAAEGVVLALVVVVAHLVVGFAVVGRVLVLCDFDVGVLAGRAALVFDVVRGGQALSVVALGDVDLGLAAGAFAFDGDVYLGAGGGGVVAVLAVDFDVDVGVAVGGLAVFSVAMGRELEIDLIIIAVIGCGGVRNLDQWLAVRLPA